MNRRKFSAVCAVAAIMALAAIGSEPAPWSIAMYGGWDNTQFGLFPSDLWGYSRLLLSKVAKKAPSNIPFVLLYDGLKQSDSELIDLRSNQSLDDHGDVIDPATREVNYGDPRTLSSFVVWMNKTFPSKYFMLGYGHHYGWEGFNTDESSPGPKNMDILTMPEYRRAMTEARNTGVRIDVQWFEACSPLMIETLYEYSPFSTYVVGNEDTIDFFDMAVRFPRALSRMRANPDMTPEDAAKLLVRAYPLHTPSYFINQITPFQYTLNPRAPSTKGELGIRKWSPTQFAIDCRRIPDVVQALDRLAVYLIYNMDSRAALKAQRKAQKYTLVPWYVDLYDWADQLEILSDDPVIKIRCQMLKYFVTRAVVASKKLDNDTRRHGILIIMPPNRQKWKMERENEFDPSTNYYDLSFAKDTHWDEFLDTLFYE